MIGQELSIGMVPTAIVVFTVWIGWALRHRLKTLWSRTLHRDQHRREEVAASRRRHPSYPYGKFKVQWTPLPETKFYDQDEQPWT